MVVVDVRIFSLNAEEVLPVSLNVTRFPTISTVLARALRKQPARCWGNSVESTARSKGRVPVRTGDNMGGNYKPLKTGPTVDETRPSHSLTLVSAIASAPIDVSA